MSVSVSVVLPTFNRVRLLPAAIASVLSQSFDDLELIVVDDCSTEDVEGLVRGIGDTRLRFIRRHRNGGAAAARNTGIAEARGKFIAFQDSDDLWLPGKLARQVALLSSLPAGIGAVVGAKIIHGRDQAFKFGPTKVAFAPSPQGRLVAGEDQLGRLLAENRISVQTALFRRECLPSRTWFDPCARANEDWDFAVRLVQHTTIYEDLEPVVFGSISPDSISKSTRKQLIGLLRIFKKQKVHLSARKRTRSMMMVDISRALYSGGKRRWGRRFLLAGLHDYPWNVTTLVRPAFRRMLVLARVRSVPAQVEILSSGLDGKLSPASQRP